MPGPPCKAPALVRKPSSIPMHFVGEMIVADRDKEKVKAMKKAKEGDRPRAAFARSDVW